MYVRSIIAVLLTGRKAMKSTAPKIVRDFVLRSVRKDFDLSWIAAAGRTVGYLESKFIFENVQIALLDEEGEEVFVAANGPRWSFDPHWMWVPQAGIGERHPRSIQVATSSPSTSRRSCSRKQHSPPPEPPWPEFKVFPGSYCRN